MTITAPAFKPGGFREFTSIAYPLVISNASITLMHFMDRLFLSWSSPEEIAACIPAGILAWTILAVFIGTSEYTNTFVAQYYGAKDSSSIGKAVWHGILISLAGGVICMGVMPLGVQLFDHIGHPPDIVLYEKQYFSIFFAGGTFILLKGALSGFYSGRGKTKVIMVVNITANFFNALLDYALIFGRWGCPKMGIRGAALATVISTLLICLLFGLMFFSSRNAHRYNTRQIHFDLSFLKQIIRFGMPSGIQFFLKLSSFTVFIFLIGQLGKVELAASNIVLALNSLAWLPMLGAGMATATLVGQYIGRNDYKTAEKSAYTALLSVEIYMLLFAVIYIALPDLLLSWFRSGQADTGVPFEEIKHYGRALLIFVAIYQISDASNITFSGALRGSGDTAFAMWANGVFAWLLFVPGTYMTVVWFKQGLLGAWIWATIYISLLGGAFGWRFKTGHWKTIRVLPERNQEPDAIPLVNEKSI